jgi:GDPmannose 4,6-dehydratase
MNKRALITGITGQDGTYLAKFLLEKGYEVYGFIGRRINQSFSNLDYFGITEKVNFIHGDITDISSINHALHMARPHEVYNLAAMSFVGLSWQEPIHTANVDAMGPLYLLEAVKKYSPDAKVYQASTSEMFGNSMEVDCTQNEMTPFRPRSPYGFSKLFAHNAIVNYRESYSMYACSGILFNHESPIRGKEFVTRKITDGVARIKAGLQTKIELGNLDPRRDWGFAGDYVEAMWMMLQQEVPEDFVIATGKTWSIGELCDQAFAEAGLDNWQQYVEQNPAFVRPAEVYHLKGNPTKANEVLGWEPKTSFDTLISEMVQADLKRYNVTK